MKRSIVTPLMTLAACVVAFVTLLGGCGEIHERNEERRCSEGKVESCQAKAAAVEVREDDPSITKYGRTVIVEIDGLDGHQLEKARSRCGSSGVYSITPVSTHGQACCAGVTNYLVYLCNPKL